MEKNDLLTIEQLIDKYGIAQTLATLSEICHEKAQHVRENWQDDPLAKAWDKNGSKIGRIILTD